MPGFSFPLWMKTRKPFSLLFLQHEAEPGKGKSLTLVARRSLAVCASRTGSCDWVTQAWHWGRQQGHLVRAGGRGCAFIATSVIRSHSLGSEATVMCGTLGTCTLGHGEHPFHRYLGYLLCHVSPSPSGPISKVVQFKSYPEETNKNQSRLTGRRVVLGMEPKA